MDAQLKLYQRDFENTANRLSAFLPMSLTKDSDIRTYVALATVLGTAIDAIDHARNPPPGKTAETAFIESRKRFASIAKAASKMSEKLSKSLLGAETLTAGATPPAADAV